ncbi:MAG: hypothetical protein JKY94_01455 [Rhodobacteraceae bacterium]|nr:hypothetical protein [Paracoccaceae bacterium]
MKYLATKFGLSVSSIRRILKNAEIEVRREPHGRPALLNLKPISQGHIWVGTKLDTYLMRHSSMQELSVKIGMSTHQISLARFGTYDFTLSDLQRINKVLNVDLSAKLVEGEDLVHA